MFQCGQTVLYVGHGVCRILELETRQIDKKNVEYFVLEPIVKTGSRYYVPTKNQITQSKMLPLLTKESLDELWKSEDAHADVWVEDDNQRKNRYRTLLNSGDRAAIVCMIRTLHRHREIQIAAGRKFHISDDAFLRDAERLLGEEIAFVLNISASEAAEHIEKNVLE